MKNYRDNKYFCRRCGKPDVFSAEDQKYSYEVKGNYIWQRRVLCQNCWGEANAIRKELRSCEKRWLDEKSFLKEDVDFLSRWRELLVRLEEYVPEKPDTAKKHMLANLIERNT